MRNRANAAILATLLCMVMLNSGCSGFNREWRQALAAPAGAGELSGPWEGTWLSDRNGHRGRLRCVMKPVAEGEYEASFHATFWKVLSAGYVVRLSAERTGETYRLLGTADLGPLAGGEYHYQGRATPREFWSWYDSRFDYGVFEMRRPEGLNE